MPTQAILVTSTEELTQAYAVLSNTSDGGDILVAPGAAHIEIDLRTGGNGPVTIRSADPDAPVTISRISLQNVENVSVTELSVDSTGIDRPDWQNDIYVIGGRNNEISNVTFSSNATGYYDPDDPDAVLGARLGHARQTEDFTFADNHVSHYYQGLSVLEVQGAEIDGNTFTHLQGDGIRMSGVQDIVISNNHMSDFHGTVQTFNHSDMIQLFTTNAQSVSDNILVTGNTLMSGAGVATQSIFFHNEDLRAGDPDAELFTNITITNNLIHNGHMHGITVDGGSGVYVADNTLLWNSDSVMISTSGSDPVSFPPQIRVEDTVGAVVENNLTMGLAGEPDMVATGNTILSYDIPQDPHYVGTHFVHPFAGADADISDLRLRPDSPLLGGGAEQSDPLVSTEGGVAPVVITTTDPADPQTVVFDAGFSVDEGGFINPDHYDLEWHFPDGSVKTGVTVSHHFETPGTHAVDLRILEDGALVATDVYGLEVQDADFILLDFETGLVDGSSNATTIMEEGATLVASHDGTGLRIGGDDYIMTGRDNDHYHNLDSFSVEMDLTLLGETSGRFLQFHGVMYGHVDPDGQMQFELRTDHGTFVVNSAETHLQPDVTHAISISYSDSAGLLELGIDDAVVGVVEASGTTAAQSSHGVVLGSQFTAGADAIVDNFRFGASLDAGEAMAPDPRAPEDFPTEAEQDPATEADPDPTIPEPPLTGDMDPGPNVPETPATEDQGPGADPVPEPMNPIPDPIEFEPVIDPETVPPHREPDAEPSSATAHQKGHSSFMDRFMDLMNSGQSGMAFVLQMLGLLMQDDGEKATALGAAPTPEPTEPSFLETSGLLLSQADSVAFEQAYDLGPQSQRDPEDQEEEGVF